jgi:Polyketide cyclase / dehydrase and lipid transport
MTQAHHETHIRRSIEDVFDFLADGSNNPAWQPFVISTTADGESVGVGSTFHQMIRHPFGYEISSDYRITEYDRPFELTFDITSGGPLRPTLTYALTRVGEELTNVRCTLTYRPGGLGALTRPVFALLDPLFAWDTWQVERAGELLETASQGVWA